MGIFANTKSRVYTKERVRRLSNSRASAVPKSGDVSKIDNYRHKLGKLLAAGHLKINGFNKMELTLSKTDDIFANSKHIFKKHSVEFTTVLQDGSHGDAPHLTGYLESGNEIDSKYRIKGWFNEDGTIRIELVN